MNEEQEEKLNKAIDKMLLSERDYTYKLLLNLLVISNTLLNEKHMIDMEKQAEIDRLWNKYRDL